MMDSPGGNSDENVNFLNKDSCQNVPAEIPSIRYFPPVEFSTLQ